MASASFLTSIAGSPGRGYSLLSARSGGVLATQVEPAFDSRSRRRGLLGREKLNEGEGLIIAPCSSIHTFFMRFAIDVIFAAKDGRVLKIHPALPPWRIAFAIGAFAVIELPAGTLSRCDVKRGDTLQIDRCNPHA